MSCGRSSCVSSVRADRRRAPSRPRPGSATYVPPRSSSSEAGLDGDGPAGASGRSSGCVIRCRGRAEATSARWRSHRPASPSRSRRKTRASEDRHLARVRQQTAWLLRRRQRWCRRGALPVICVVHARRIQRVEHEVMVVSIDRLIPVLRSVVGWPGRPNELGMRGLCGSGSVSNEPVAQVALRLERPNRVPWGTAQREALASGDERLVAAAKEVFAGAGGHERSRMATAVQQPSMAGRCR